MLCRDRATLAAAARLVIVLTGPAGRSPEFLTDKVLTLVGQMGKIRENGGLSGWDKKWILRFLSLTVLVEPDKLGTLDKCDIVEIVCG
jgi:hypothetical protein